jgi:uncharacterized protein (DUF1330 family)
MSVYIIVRYDISDPEVFKGYPPAVMPLLHKHGAEVLVADFAAQAVEGQASGAHVVIRFPSEEAARNWYNDPAYAPVRQIRLNSTKNGNAVLAKEFAAPSA